MERILNWRDTVSWRREKIEGELGREAKGSFSLGLLVSSQVHIISIEFRTLVLATCDGPFGGDVSDVNWRSIEFIASDMSFTLKINSMSFRQHLRYSLFVFKADFNSRIRTCCAHVCRRATKQKATDRRRCLRVLRRWKSDFNDNLYGN